MLGTTRLHRTIAVVLGASTLAFVLLLAGVGSGLLTDDPPAVSPYATGSTETTAAAGGPAVFAVTAVGFTSSGYIEITNVGGTAGDIGGLWLCNRPSYWELPSVVLEPGASVLIAEADDPLTDAAVQRGPIAVLAAGGSIGSIDPSGGEIGVYTSSSFGDSGAIVSYVEWGFAGHGRSSVAVGAGIWDDGGFVASEGASLLEAADGAATASSGWLRVP